MRSSARTVQPFGWMPARGYSNGVLAEGRLLFVAGQIGWDPRSPKPKLPKSFAEQFDQALSNVLEVVREAGGEAANVARVTLYVVNKAEYTKSRKQLGASWRAHFGRHYPAMTLVEVSALLEPGAKVEIEATGVV